MMQFELFRSATIAIVLVGLSACSGVASPSREGAIASTGTCPAKDLQYLVGQPRSALFTMRFGSEVRIEMPGEMYTMDYKAARTRIVISTDERIARVLCG
jgi:hypothetical protein